MSVSYIDAFCRSRSRDPIAAVRSCSTGPKCVLSLFHTLFLNFISDVVEEVNLRFRQIGRLTRFLCQWHREWRSPAGSKVIINEDYLAGKVVCLAQRFTAVVVFLVTPTSSVLSTLQTWSRAYLHAKSFREVSNVVKCEFHATQNNKSRQVDLVPVFASARQYLILQQAEKLGTSGPEDVDGNLVKLRIHDRRGGSCLKPRVSSARSCTILWYGDPQCCRGTDQPRPFGHARHRPDCNGKVNQQALENQIVSFSLCFGRCRWGTW
jgi:hypothetical protein